MYPRHLLLAALALTAQPALADIYDANADTTVLGAIANSDLGQVVADAGDLNGDGFRDLVVGAPRYSNGQNNEGAALVYLGDAGGIDATPDAIYEGGTADLRAGTAVAGVGDFNGDGYDDFIVGVPGDDGAGTDAGVAFLFLGGAVLDANPDGIFGRLQTGATSGTSVAGLGDANGDGYADLAVGSPLFDGTAVDAGRVDVYFGGAAINTTSDGVIQSGMAGLRFGSALSAAHDANGDGYADLLVGTPFFASGQTNEGAVYVYLGGAGTGFNTASDLIIQSNQAEAQIGLALAGLGDVNGDGFSDFAVGAPLFNNASTEGAVFVYHGAATLDGTADATLATALTATNGHGTAVAGADINGDGFRDLLIGAPQADANGGRVRVHLGSRNGLVTTPLLDFARIGGFSERFGQALAGVDGDRDGYTDVVAGMPARDSARGGFSVYRGRQAPRPSTAADAIAAPTQSGAQLGRSVASGDVNGDGFADLAGGAPMYDPTAALASAGRVSLYLGTAGGFDATADAQIDGAIANAQTGYSVAIGDLNGDGFGDLIVGAPILGNGQTAEGRVSVYLGGAGTFDTTADLDIESNSTNARFGWQVAYAGDVNGDGFGDFVVGAPFHDVPGTPSAGRAFLYLGGSTLDGTADLTISASNNGNQLGAAVAGIGDINGDGYSDWAVGEPEHDGNGINSGRMIVYFGSATPDGAGDLVMLGNAASHRLGAQIGAVGDVNGDGYPDFTITSAPPPSFSGEIDLFLGGATPSASAHVVLTETTAPGLGLWATGADLSGDGYSDLAVSTSGQGGSVIVYLGGAGNFNVNADWFFNLTQTSPAFGTSIATTDVNGDGYADLVSGVPQFDASVADTGALHVYLMNYQQAANNGGRGYAPQHFKDATSQLADINTRVVSGVTVAMDAFPWNGRERARLELQVCPVGAAFGDLRCASAISGTWVDTTTAAQGALVTGLINAPASAPERGFRWRARLQYAPWSITAPGITVPVSASRVTPWKRIRGQSEVSDFRRPPSALFSVGGSITGLGTGLTVVLRNAVTGEDLSRSTNGAYTFATAQASGASYNVSVLTQPTGQTCTVANASGTVASANVGNVNVSCTGNTYTVRGSLSGLGAGLSVVLRNTVTGENLTRNADGGFTFATAQATGASYNVSVQTHPTGQTCTVSNGSGTIGTSNVVNVEVACANNPTGFTVGGTLSGLAAARSVVLRNTMTGEDLTRSINGAYTFSTTQLTGASYNVSVQTQPIGQTCTVSNSNGSIASANVSNVNISCVTVDALFANGFE